MWLVGAEEKPMLQLEQLQSYICLLGDGASILQRSHVSIFADRRMLVSSSDRFINWIFDLYAQLY